MRPFFSRHEFVVYEFHDILDESVRVPSHTQRRMQRRGSAISAALQQPRSGQPPPPHSRAAASQQASADSSGTGVGGHTVVERALPSAQLSGARTKGVPAPDSGVFRLSGTSAQPLPRRFAPADPQSGRAVRDALRDLGPFHGGSFDDSSIAGYQGYGDRLSASGVALAAGRDRSGQQTPEASLRRRNSAPFVARPHPHDTQRCALGCVVRCAVWQGLSAHQQLEPRLKRPRLAFDVHGGRAGTLPSLSPLRQFSPRNAAGGHASPGRDGRPNHAAVPLAPHGWPHGWVGQQGPLHPSQRPPGEYPPGLPPARGLRLHAEEEVERAFEHYGHPGNAGRVLR